MSLRLLLLSLCMSKKLISVFFVLFILVSFVSHADNMSLPLKNRIARRGNIKSPDNEKIQVMATVSDEFAIDRIAEIEGDHIMTAGNTIFVSLPKERVETFASLRGVRRVDVPQRAWPTLNVVRQVCGVDKVHNPIDNSYLPYTGKGVIVGVVDVGINPTHPAFFTADGSESRVGLYALTESSEESESGQTEYMIAIGEDEISKMKIDNSSEGHGTHVASIAAGSSYLSEIYSGMAPDSEIAVVSMGQYIYDDEMIKGMQILADYAESRGKPLVVNFSIGNTVGPHDGVGAVQDAMMEADKKGIIPVFAAGNDGNIEISLQKDFNKDSTPLSSILVNGQNAKYPPANFHVEAWSRDHKGFRFVIRVVDMNEKRIVEESPEFSIDDFVDGGMLLCSADESLETKMPAWSKYYPGTVELASGVDLRNNRFYLQLAGETDADKKDLTYTFALSIIPDSSSSAVTVYTSSSLALFSSLGIKGYVYGNPKESISDFCTSPAVISVGMTNARDKWINILGEEKELSNYAGKLNEINNNSSFGSIAGAGEIQLPVVVAPGWFILGAINPEVEIKDSRISMVKELNGKQYKWGDFSGTSMAAPAVAGIIALWLEAEPGLTKDDIMNVIKNSSFILPEFNNKRNTYGYGNIDAYAGLKYILNRTSVGVSVSDSDKILIKTLPGGILDCTVPALQSSADVTLYSASGAIADKYTVNSKSFTISTSNLSKGIYILRVTGDNCNVNHKVAVN